jgi:hypothetical protein
MRMLANQFCGGRISYAFCRWKKGVRWCCWN